MLSGTLSPQVSIIVPSGAFSGIKLSALTGISRSSGIGIRKSVHLNYSLISINNGSIYLVTVMEIIQNWYVIPTTNRKWYVYSNRFVRWISETKSEDK